MYGFEFAVGTGDEKCACALPGEALEGLVEFGGIADVDCHKLQSKLSCRRFDILLMGRGIGRAPIEQRRNDIRTGNQLVQQRKPLRIEQRNHRIDAGQVAARPVEAWNETVLDWIVAAAEHNGDCRGGCLGRQCRRGAAAGHDDHHLALHEIGGHRREQIGMAIGPAILDRKVSAIDIASFVQASPKCGCIGFGARG
jgi:hypothetical protein